MWDGKLLAMHRITSAPVIDAKSGRFEGFVDAADLLGTMCKGEVNLWHASTCSP